MRRDRTPGAFIQRQAVFTNKAIRHICTFQRQRCLSLIILAHSMGGIVARSLPLEANYDAALVQQQTILTFNTPHRHVAEAPSLVSRSLAADIAAAASHPPYAVSRSLQQHYRLMHRSDEQENGASSLLSSSSLTDRERWSLSTVTLVSMCGGSRDTLIRADLCRVRGSNRLALLTESMAGLDMAIDHDVRSPRGAV